jgi:hypothetical protein
MLRDESRRAVAMAFLEPVYDQFTESFDASRPPGRKSAHRRPPIVGVEGVPYGVRTHGSKQAELAVRQTAGAQLIAETQKPS